MSIFTQIKKFDSNSWNLQKLTKAYYVLPYRLYVSKMKSEVKNLVHRTTLLESSQTDGTAKINQMEKDLSEQRLIAGTIQTWIISYIV